MSVDIKMTKLDVMYDPQTSAGLLIAARPEVAQALMGELSDKLPCAKIVGYMEREREDCSIAVK